MQTHLDQADLTLLRKVFRNEILNKGTKVGINLFLSLAYNYEAAIIFGSRIIRAVTRTMGTYFDAGV